MSLLYTPIGSLNIIAAGLIMTLLPASVSSQTAFGPERAITNDAEDAQSVFAADIDGDGDQDVFSASLSDDKIAWYENLDGAGTFGTQQIISVDAQSARTVFAADLDGDGDKDVLSASWADDTIAWYENLDGMGGFGPQVLISADARGALHAYAVDIDDDGDIDVYSSLEGHPKMAGWGIVWYENTGQGNFGLPTTIRSFSGSRHIHAADLDGDGDMDIVGSSYHPHEVSWYEFEGGEFGDQQLIGTDAEFPNSVFAADVDGDGDYDVLSASQGDDLVAWYENTDGLGTFGPLRVITVLAETVNSVFAADLDGDGDNDVLSASRGDDEVAWYENLDGLGSFGPKQIISTTADFANVVFVADLDGDGDADVLSASRNDDKIAWYENLSKATSTEPGQELPPGILLSAPSPNPFQRSVRFSLEMAEPQNVVIEVYNILGQRVSTVFDGPLASHIIHWFTYEPRSLVSGNLVIQISGEMFQTTRAVSLMK